MLVSSTVLQSNQAWSTAKPVSVSASTCMSCCRDHVLERNVAPDSVDAASLSLLWQMRCVGPQGFWMQLHCVWLLVGGGSLAKAAAETQVAAAGRAATAPACS